MSVTHKRDTKATFQVRHRLCETSVRIIISVSSAVKVGLPAREIFDFKLSNIVQPAGNNEAAEVRVQQ